MNTQAFLDLEACFRALDGLVVRSRSEKVLQAAIHELLTEAGLDLDVIREASLTERDRVDFLVRSVALEVKVDGSPNAVLRQLHRYAQSDRVGAILLVSTRARLTQLPCSLNGKPVRALHLIGGAF